MITYMIIELFFLFLLTFCCMSYSFILSIIYSNTSNNIDTNTSNNIDTNTPNNTDTNTSTVELAPVWNSGVPVDTQVPVSSQVPGSEIYVEDDLSICLSASCDVTNGGLPILQNDNGDYYVESPNDIETNVSVEPDDIETDVNQISTFNGNIFVGF